MKLRNPVNIFYTQLFHNKLLKYRKIPVISPGLMQVCKGGLINGGAYIRGAYKWNKKSASKRAMPELIVSFKLKKS